MTRNREHGDATTSVRDPGQAMGPRMLARAAGSGGAARQALALLDAPAGRPA